MENTIVEDLTPIEQAEYIHEEYKKYLRGSFNFSDKSLRNTFIKSLNDEPLLKGPFIEMVRPFRKGASLEDLINQKKISSSFRHIIKENLNRPLYSHQQKALEIINANKNTVITTGTGSGKTESFLYPILNKVLEEIDRGILDSGIRAIFLYPMNALVNDQMERIRELLKDYPQIKYGAYTRHTGHTEKDVNHAGFPENELLSREAIRKNPPHFLFTNYAMLEYLLLRPNDNTLISPQAMKYWQFVVLDEAHTYMGSKGIEISHLLKRLCIFTDKTPTFILTSATLGTKGKSEKDIKKFADSLTSSNFSEEDIIFAERHDLVNKEARYTLSSEEYITLANNIKNPDKVKHIFEKYSIPLSNINENLFDLLKNDSNVIKLYNFLKDTIKTFKDIEETFNNILDKKNLSYLIDLINLAEKKGSTLFNLRYHSFIRPLSGGYASFSSPRKLSLKKTDKIGDYKAFEVGVCTSCNGLYIIGQIRKNNTDKLYYLRQNNEIDIYENYGENNKIQLDYFIPISKEQNNSPLQETLRSSDKTQEYTLCSRCGCVSLKNNRNAKKCKCGEEFELDIFKIIEGNENDLNARNNIHKCLYCKYGKTSGIVQELSLGKDQGTALVAQALYASMEKAPIVEKSTVNKRLFKRKKITKVKPTKQFLSFSDSRADASFSTVFFNYNHSRFLRKRLLCSIMEKNDYKDIPLYELQQKIKAELEKNNYFINEDTKSDPEIEAWITILIELLKVDGRNDGEGLGLYYFDADLSGFLEDHSEKEVEEIILDELPGYNIKSLKDYFTLIQIILSVFKTVPAIKYTSMISPDIAENHLEYRRFLNTVVLQPLNGTNKHIHSLLPKSTAHQNQLIRYICKACDCTPKAAGEFIEKTIDFLNEIDFFFRENAGLQNSSGFKINAEKFIFKSYKHHPFYKCKTCGRVTPYNFNNVCTKDRCNGKLEEIFPDQDLAYNYYRQQYKIKTLEPIVIREHTAQLGHQKAADFQKAFKEKKINILCCSTTFEMGIDIGDLNTVFMRNVPPNPANYVQRAGRAGRRKGSSPFIITYCNNNTHEYNYFATPEKMISGTINPPYFNTSNKKILIRHILATCLGLFFRKYPEYYKNIGQFIFNNGVVTFIKYLESRPTEIDNFINKKLLDSEAYKEYRDFRWLNMEDGPIEKINMFASYLQTINYDYSIAISNSSGKNKDDLLKQKNKFMTERLIDNLSKYGIIPKYGFPTDLVNLEILDRRYGSITVNEDIELSRDLKIAISEYAPGSEVVVEKIKYESKYIKFPKGKSNSEVSILPRNSYILCPHCNTGNTFVVNTGARSCSNCGMNLPMDKTTTYIEPKFGFSAHVSDKKNSILRPKKSYVGDYIYVGNNLSNKKADTVTFSNMGIEISTSSDDEFLVVNKSDFYVCNICGYGKINKKLSLDTLEYKHTDRYDKACSNSTLHKIKLGHKFKTDIAKISIKNLTCDDDHAMSTALSFMYALIEGVSLAFDIERSDLNCILQKNLNENIYEILLFDDVPGGAGHVKRLVNKEKFIAALKAAKKIVDKECCDERTSCYKCLRNYYNKKFHDKLRRKYARDLINKLLKDI